MEPLSVYDSIPSAFAARARESKDQLALHDGTRRVTFAELDAHATALAAGLAARGLRAGAHVGVLLPRSIDAVIGALGILRAGAVLVPLDPAWPTARRRRVVRDAELAFVISREGATADDGDARVLDLVDLLASSLDAPLAAPSPVAVALYTSGSTGEPKAVLLSHRGILARLHALALALPYLPTDVACHRTPLTFVDALAELLGPLLGGVPLRVLPHPFAMADLVKALAEDRISRLLLVPSLLALLLDACPELGARANTLRLVVSSGETLSPSLARRFHSAAPGVRLVNVYGSTEVTGDATLGEIAFPVPSRISIGRPLEGVQVHLIDASGARVAGNGVGEIVVGGAMVALGYWRRPELTRERFVLSSTDGRAVVHTGDLARRLGDGSLELVGRIDDQVKIGGVRINLGEIANALETHGAVRDAAVTTDVQGGLRRVLAGVVAKAGRATDASLHAELVAHLAARLPSAAMPSVLAFVDAVPRAAHGKVDRAALARAITARSAALEAEVPTPARADGDDPLVARFAALFIRLLGVPCADADAELGLLGGDSLTRLRLLVLLERDGFTLTHAQLPSPLTPSTLAAVVRARTPRPAAEPFVLAARDARTLDRAAPERLDAFPLTDFQKVMTLESLANARTSIWCDQVALAIEGHFSSEDFERAWRRVVAREPSLRTTIAWRGLAEPLQVVQRDVPVSIDRHPLTELDRAAYRQRVLAEEWERMSSSFALDTAPLWRLCILQGPDARQDLVFTYHHVILDGESARRVLRAAFDDYAGRRPDSAAPSESFRSFVERVRAPSNDELSDRLDLVDLPTEASQEAAPSSPLAMGDLVWRTFHRAVDLRQRIARLRVGARVRQSSSLAEVLTQEGLSPKPYAGGDILDQPLSRVLARAVRAWARQANATPTSVWMAVYALHLARERGCFDVLFGVIVAGRDGRTAGTVGMLANCLPLRIRIHADEPIALFVARVSTAVRELERHSGTPLLALARATRLDPRSFLDTLFVTWAFGDEGWEAPQGLRVHDLRGVTSTATDLAVILSATGEAWDLAVASSAFHRADRVRLHLLALLDALLDAPAQERVSTLLELVARDGGMAVALAGL